MPPQFDHEKLKVYQEAIRFVAWAHDLLQGIPKSLAVRDQLDRASTSVPLNLAEGNGKFTAPDRCKFFDNARGSALECGSCLDVLVAKRQITADTAEEGKAILVGIVSMLVGLIKSQSANRVYEEPVQYGGVGRITSKSRSKN
ncbi:MAG: four helix bundle protein [Verrucomicrobiota bacterium]